MPRRPSPPPKPPDWPLDRTLSALKRQLNALDGLRGRNYQEAENDERTWQNLTQNVLTRGFGEGSNNVNQFFHARNVGDHFVYEVHPSIYQSNFDKRIAAYKATLDSSIAELEMMIPAPEIAGAMSPATTTVSTKT